MSIQLPFWATSHNPELIIRKGVQLCTRDGRRVGNAHIIDIINDDLFLVLTDAGNQMKLNSNEVNELYYVGEFVGDVNEIIKHFGRKED